MTQGEQIKLGLSEFKIHFTYLRNKWLKKCDQTSKEHFSLTLFPRLDAHVSWLHSLEQRRRIMKIITKPFNILDWKTPMLRLNVSNSFLRTIQNLATQTRYNRHIRGLTSHFLFLDGHYLVDRQPAVILSPVTSVTWFSRNNMWYLCSWI